MEDCKPCPFGYTSRAGAENATECVRVAQQCAPGQIAPPGAESPEQCACLAGYGGMHASVGHQHLFLLKVYSKFTIIHISKNKLYMYTNYNY
jgi:hypothetical protein